MVKQTNKNSLRSVLGRVFFLTLFVAFLATGQSAVAYGRDFIALGEDGLRSSVLLVQGSPEVEAVPINPPPSRGTLEALPSPKTMFEVYLTFLTVLLGIGILGIYCYLHRGSDLTVEFSRHFIILTVIFAALFLIVAGYSEKQTAPVFGLLGTIIGYLFGVISGNTATRMHATKGQDMQESQENAPSAASDTSKKS